MRSDASDSGSSCVFFEQSIAPGPSSVSGLLSGSVAITRQVPEGDIGTGSLTGTEKFPSLSVKVMRGCSKSQSSKKRIIQI